MSMTDEYHAERLVQDSLSPQRPGVVEQVVTAVKNLILPTHKELIQQLRIPTPLKITQTFTASAGGVIGGGLANPVPLTIWTCPVSTEAWIHRATFTSPGHGPAAPLTTGQVVLLGGQSGLGETVWFLPQNGNVAPVQFTEGRASAPHLNSGETLGIVADTLPANTVLRIDLQILLTTQGLSGFTPRVAEEYI